MRWGTRQIRWVKRMDRVVGACLDLLGRPTAPRRQAATEPDRILFVKFWGMGSIILTQPAINFLRRRYPKAEIHYLTTEDNLPLVGLFAGVDDTHGLRASNWACLLIEAARVAKRLRRLRFDLVFDGESLVASSAWICRLLKAGLTVGFMTGAGAGGWHNLGVAYKRRQHAVRQFLNLVSVAESEEVGSPAVGGGAPSSLPSPGSGELPRPQLKLPERRSLVILRPYLVFNVNASPLALERRWPRERFVQLAKVLLRDFDLDLVLTGTASEKAYVDRVAAALESPGRVRNLSGRLQLLQFAELIADAVAVVSNDSGPVHLASAFDVPVVSFYGPETPQRYGPLSRSRLVFYRDIECSPCMSVENAKTVNCPNRQRCMREIATEAVVGGVAHFLSGQLEPRLPVAGRNHAHV